MEHVSQASVKPTLPLFLWLIVLNLIISGCSNNQNDTIQSVTTHKSPVLHVPQALLREKEKETTTYKPAQKETNPLKYIVNHYDTPILIKAKQSQLNIQPILNNKILFLGNSQISHWPLNLPKCKTCNSEVTRTFHPDGPDTHLKLKAVNTDYQWGVFESSQKQSYLLNLKIFFNNSGQLSMTTRTTNNQNSAIFLKPAQSYDVNNCRVTPLWIENKKPMSSDYSDDQAKHKIQIVYECNF